MTFMIVKIDTTNYDMFSPSVNILTTNIVFMIYDLLVISYRYLADIVTIPYSIIII